MRRRPAAPFNPETYARWRATIPFTDDQVADALLAEAADRDLHAPGYAAYLRERAAGVRAGRLTIWTLVKALPHLIKFCFRCGKTALYRNGNRGSCRDHRQELMRLREKVDVIRSVRSDNKRIRWNEVRARWQRQPSRNVVSHDLKEKDR